MGVGELYKKAEDEDLVIYLFIINTRRRNLRRKTWIVTEEKYHRILEEGTA